MTDLPADIAESAHLGPAYQWLHAFALGHEWPWRDSRPDALEQTEIRSAIEAGLSEDDAFEACFKKRESNPAFDLADLVKWYATSACRHQQPSGAKSKDRLHPRITEELAARINEHRCHQMECLRSLAGSVVVAALGAPAAADSIARVAEEGFEAGNACGEGVEPFMSSFVQSGMQRHFERIRGGRKKLGKSAATEDQREKFLGELAEISTRHPNLSYSRRVVKAVRRSGFPLSERRARDIGRQAGFS